MITARDIPGWIRSGPMEYVMCRTLGHVWMDGASFKHQIANVGIARALRCERCSMERLDVFDSNFELIGRKYSQPDGYAKPADDDAVRGAMLTAESLRRAKASTKRLGDAQERYVEGLRGRLLARTETNDLTEEVSV